MNILSFDVGIKNLAYCLVNVVDANATKFNILDWGVINLISTNNTDDASHKCMTCTKKASLQTIANDRHYCAIHAKKDAHFKPIDNKFKEFAVVHSLNKIPMKRLNEFIAHYSIIIASGTGKKPLKGELLEIVKKFISDYCFVKCGSGEKKKKANDFDLVRLGVALRDKLDATFSAEIRQTIDKIVIENQIGPLAIRMKSLQGMITQYFIMKELTDISYISASNKLKMFEGSELMYCDDDIEEKNVEDKDKESKKKYKERKDKSVEIVAKLVDGMPVWEKVFKTHAKKDDLADSLLQALWYASSK
jgi:hypothetical protein